MDSTNMPNSITISARQCAEEALAGFAQGKAMIFPGQMLRVGMTVLRVLPRSLKRLAFSGIRKRMLKEARQHERELAANPG